MGEKTGVEIRKKIYDFILKYPGLHLSELSRKMDMPKSTINYHLNHLKKQKQIVRKDDDKYTRYYIANNVGENEKKILHILRQETPREIIIYLLLNPNSSQIKISKDLNKHPTTISFHLNKLNNVDMIESMITGNEIKYNIKNSEHVLELFTKYRESFVDTISNYVICLLLS